MDGLRQSARDPARCTGSLNCMFGGTDWLLSRDTGPSGTAVTGTSISDAGVPNRYKPPGDAVRHGEKAVSSATCMTDGTAARESPFEGCADIERGPGMLSFGRLFRL
jgi:hypothetical protein